MHYFSVLSSLADHKLVKGRAFISAVSYSTQKPIHFIHQKQLRCSLKMQMRGETPESELANLGWDSGICFLLLLLRGMFYSVGIFRTSSLGDSISGNPERTALRRRGHGGARSGEKSGYTEVCNKGWVV